MYDFFDKEPFPILNLFFFLCYWLNLQFHPEYSFAWKSVYLALLCFIKLFTTEYNSKIKQ